MRSSRAISPYLVAVVLLFAATFACSNGGLVDVSEVKLTPSIVAWISSQAESIINEMEAIVKQNTDTNKFSVVSYLRYITLYDGLKVVASKKIPELQWVARKAKAFTRTYKSAIDIVSNYLEDLDTQLTNIELNEPKGKQLAPSAQWLELYNTINYIATHAPKSSGLVDKAKFMMQKSPNETDDKVRATRYLLNTRAFN